MLLPSQCEVCRSWGAARLCGDCCGRFAPALPRCRRCAIRTTGDDPVCADCRRDPPPFEHTVCIADYAFPWDRLVADFKFNRRAELATALAPLLARAAATVPAPDVVVAVPLAPRRLAERGYNQAWELARRLGRPARAGLLMRPHDGRHQADLPRAERLANLRAAFAVEAGGRDALRGRRVALVDDVFTTGATLREAARTLLAAGAAAVDAWVVARTPDD